MDAIQSHNLQQRPQAELKPAALAFRRFGIGRLGLHRRIIPGRGQPEQEILAAPATPNRSRRSDRETDRSEASYGQRAPIAKNALAKYIRLF